LAETQGHPRDPSQDEVSVARFALASRAQIDRIMRETHALWGGGLSYGAYRELWEELGSSAWATRFAHYYVLEDDDGQVLSSLKLYRPRIRVGTRQGRCSVLGAVFTPARLRRRGFAAEAVRAALEESERANDVAALLFSDIGTRYYARFGFRPLPAWEQTGRLPPAPRWLADDLTFRPARVEDLELLSQAHLASSARRSVAIVRDPAHWQFLWARTQSYFSRAANPSVRHDWTLAYRGATFVGYVISIVAAGEWSVREVGSVDGDVEIMVELLLRGGALAYRSGARRVYGWLPDELRGGLAPWRLRNVARRRAVPMIRFQDPAVERMLATGAGEAYIPFQDQF